MKLWLTLLRCPRCGGDLPRRAGDLLLACLPCATLFEVRRGTPTPVPLGVPSHALRALPEGATGWAWLPYWSFRVQAAVRGPDTTRNARAQDVLDRWPRVLVGGTMHLGRPDPYPFDREFTRLQLTGSPPEDPSMTRDILSGLLPCPRGAEAASGFVVPYLLALLDPEVDVSRLEVSSQIQDLELVAAPFARIDAGLREPLSGHVLSRRFLVPEEEP